MKKSLLNLALISALGISFSGCVGGSTPVNLYQPVKEEITLNNSQLGAVDKGAIILKNGSKIYDPEGDILASFDINNELFYILTIKDKNLYKIKNSSQKVIQEFKANGLNWFMEDNKFVLCVSLKGNEEFGLYDNVYEFNGKEFNIINKNLDLSGGAFRTGNGSTLYKSVNKSGMYYIESWFTQGNYLEKQVVTNIVTGKSVLMSDLRKRANYEAATPPVVIGVRNEIIYYTYSTGLFSSNQNFIEAYDLKTNKAYTLAVDTAFSDNNTKKKLQILKSGNQVVLKIFDNPNLKKETALFVHTRNLETKYNNEPAKIISLNTLKEVKNISSDFYPIPLFSGYENIVGSNVDTTEITTSVNDLYYAYVKSMQNKVAKPLF